MWMGSIQDALWAIDEQHVVHGAPVDLYISSSLKIHPFYDFRDNL